MSAESDAKKQRVAQAALAYLLDSGLEQGAIIGVGTGSTVNCFIDALASVHERVGAAVSSSNATTARLQAIGIKVLDLNDVDNLQFYIDGADEATRSRHLIKGGGAALTREKIVTAAASRFICIVDDDFDLHLWHEIDPVFGAAVHFRVSLLSAKAADFRDCHAANALFHESVFYVLKFEVANDGFDFFHVINS